MRLDLHRLGGKLLHRRGVVESLPVGIRVVERRVRIGERGLRKVLVDAPAPANVLRFKFDRHARSAVDGNPIQPEFREILAPFFVRGDRLALSVAVKNFGRVRFRVDADDKARRRTARRRLRNRFQRLARREQPVHSRRADPDSLLTATHAQSVKFRTVE